MTRATAIEALSLAVEIETLLRREPTRPAPRDMGEALGALTSLRVLLVAVAEARR